MRIGLIIDTDAFAGTERHMLELACALRGQGCAATLLCPRGGPLAERGTLAGVPVEFLPVGFVGAVQRLRRLLVGRTLDVIHAHNGRTSLKGALALVLAGRGKLVCTQHFIEPSRLRRRGMTAWLSRLVHRWVEQRTSRFIAISRAVRDAMLARAEVPELKIQIVPNGIRSPQPPDKARGDSIRASLDLASPVIACVSRLEPEKEVGMLVEAMAIVARRQPEAACVIAGDGSMRPEIERQVAELGLVKSVKLLGFRDDVDAIVGASDIFALPCPVEGFGLAVLEAMALGKPVIATAAGGPLEIVVCGRTGLLVPPSNPGALAEAILKLAADPQLCLKMGSAARERFMTDYTADRMAAHIFEIYRDVADGKTARSATVAGVAKSEVGLETSNVGR